MAFWVEQQVSVDRSGGNQQIAHMVYSVGVIQQEGEKGPDRGLSRKLNVGE